MTSFSDAEIRRFRELQCWIFDLDDTLYPKDCGLFSHVDARMSLFIQQFLGVSPEEAPRVQKRYFHAYGTTLKGLMHHHDVRPELFLEYVHDIDYGVVPRDDQLTAALQRLPGRKVIFTNGTTAHAAAVLKRLGADACFEAVFDIASAGYAPKPDPTPYQTLTQQLEIDPRVALMAEDMARNLIPSAAMGMTTVWVCPDGAETTADAASTPPHIHHIADRGLTVWLNAMMAAAF